MCITRLIVPEGGREVYIYNCTTIDLWKGVSERERDPPYRRLVESVACDTCWMIKERDLRHIGTVLNWGGKNTLIFAGLEFFFEYM